MSKNNFEQLGFLDSRGLIVRGGLVVVVILTLVGAFYGVRWQLGQALAESFGLNAENSGQTALAAVILAPRNSLAYSISAKVQQGRTLPDILEKARTDNEEAVRYSPKDYRYWLDLGRTREQSGDSLAGEAAMRRAVEIAPSYAYPRWMLGNLLLREDKKEAALAEFKRVAATHSTLRQQVFYLVWETSGGNADELKQHFGDTPVVRAALAVFYAGKNLPNESVQMWQSLSPDEKAENREAGRNSLRANYERLNAHAAAIFANDLGFETAEIGKITNGGFEQEIGKSADAIFGWHIDQIKNADISLDLRQPREGKRSLRVTFSGYSEPTLQVAPQLVAIESGARYRLSFAVRTADLKSAGTPVLEVADIKTSKILGASQPFAAGTNDWQNIAVEFIAPPHTQAVVIRTTRAFCGANCPIIGAIWYDDFKLERADKTEKK